MAVSCHMKPLTAHINCWVRGFGGPRTISLFSVYWFCCPFFWWTTTFYIYNMSTNFSLSLSHIISCSYRTAIFNAKCIWRCKTGGRKTSCYTSQNPCCISLVGIMLFTAQLFLSVGNFSFTGSVIFVMFWLSMLHTYRYIKLCFMYLCMFVRSYTNACIHSTKQ